MAYNPIKKCSTSFIINGIEIKARCHIPYIGLRKLNTSNISNSMGKQVLLLRIYIVHPLWIIIEKYLSKVSMQLFP